MVTPSNAEASGESSSRFLPRKRQISPTSSGNGTKKLSTMLVDPDSLHCPICYHVLSSPIFQCVNGHLACSVCCPKLSDKCPSCALRIGHIRCRPMENVLESVFVPCRNAEFGCTNNASYGNELTHEKECKFFLCSCPEQDCTYTGLYEGLFYHYNVTHRPYQLFNYYGKSISAKLNIVSDKRVILMDYMKPLLFVVQCFREPYGVYVTVSCIAPSAPEVGEFSYHLSYNVDGHKTYESPMMKMVLQVSSQTPQENFMFIPQSYLRGDEFEVKICIWELKQE